MILTSLTITVVVAFVAAVIGTKAKWLRWTIFSALLAYLSWVLWSLYGRWDYAESYRLFSLGGVKFYLNFAITKLGWFFAFFTTLINFVISIFSIRKNLAERDELGICALWILLAGANMAIFLAADWITLFIAWEVMTWTSYFIITLGWKNSFRAANYYFLLSMLGAYAMLVAIWWLWAIPSVHTFNIAQSIPGLANYWSVSPTSAVIIAILFLLGFFSKSSVFPFHPWPSEAHAEAPDDFSPYLSGIMIKYGLYGVVLFVVPLFLAITRSGYGSTINGVPVISYVLAWFGAITAVIGTILAIMENDMKRLAAWSTVANIGYAATAIFILTPLGLTGGIFHIVNHAVFKSMIFVALAAVKFRTHERQMHRLGGASTIWVFVLKQFVVFLIALSFNAVFPRFRFEDVVKWFWRWPLAISIIQLLLVIL